MEKILFVSLLDWYFTKQRPQHLAELLSKNNKVEYVCHVSWNTKNIRNHDENELISNNFSISDTLKIRRLKYLPFNKLKPIALINNFLYKIMIEIIVYRYKPDILWLTHPEQYNLIPKLFNGKIIYDCMDNYSKFSKDRVVEKHIDALERKLVNKVNFIITSSNGLKNKISCINSNLKIVVIKNATDFEYFNSYINLHEKRDKESIGISVNKKIIGYFGGISSWFDVDLLLFLANNYKGCDFVIVGPISNKSVIPKTAKADNIKFIGPKEYKKLAAYLYCFDVCIMPFIVNDLIKDVNPVKLYEYLSMGKPVVVPDYSEIKEFAEYVYLASGYEDFSKKIGQALAENDACIIKKRICFAKANTWENRVDSINELIAALEKV